jgi:hypothetical protein
MLVPGIVVGLDVVFVDSVIGFRLPFKLLEGASDTDRGIFGSRF